MSPLTKLSLTGRVATPADPDWDQARQAWNLAVDQHPAAVAFVRRRRRHRCSDQVRRRA